MIHRVLGSCWMAISMLQSLGGDVGLRFWQRRQQGQCLIVGAVFWASRKDSVTCSCGKGDKQMTRVHALGMVAVTPALAISTANFYDDKN